LRSRRFRIILSLLLALSMLFCKTPEQPAENQEPVVVFPDGFVVTLSVARTDREKALGLMFVPSLPDDRGMLFLNHSESMNPFWMKNCLINLDLLWLDANGTIVDISRNLPPCQEDPCPNYFPKAPYTIVLEVRGNLAAEHGLAVGDRLAFFGL